MPKVSKPSTQARTTPGRSWIVEGKLVQVFWRWDSVSLNVEISREEADAIEAACRDVVSEAFPDAAGETFESPIIDVDGKLCLRSWGRDRPTIHSASDPARAWSGSVVALRVMLKPYRDPKRGLRVTSFPRHVDVLVPGPEPELSDAKKAILERRSRRLVEDRAVAVAGVPTTPKGPTVAERAMKAATRPRIGFDSPAVTHGPTDTRH